jgi:N-carbamoyl-L-amino-acid hydrolase
VLAESSEQAQLDLIRAHPELAGKQMETNTLTAESTNEQKKAGLTNCTPEELEHIPQLNADYGKRFGFPSSWPCAARGLGLSKAEIIATFERRMFNHPAYEQAEALRNIHRIAEIRLNDKFGYEPVEGNEVWDWQERLSTNSDPGYAEKGQLTVTYLTDAHRACAQRISHWMREIGFDEVEIDAVGNVVGRCRHRRRQDPADRQPLRHRAQRRQVRRPPGHLCAHGLRQATGPQGKRLPFNIEVVGLRKRKASATRPPSWARAPWSATSSRNGWSRRTPTASRCAAMRMPACASTTSPSWSATPPSTWALWKCTSSRARCSTSWTSRWASSPPSTAACAMCEFIGMASHAGTTPMDRRRDAAAGVAELSLYIESAPARMATAWPPSAS